jgi:hypothetical protein
MTLQSCFRNHLRNVYILQQYLQNSKKRWQYKGEDNSQGNYVTCLTFNRSIVFVIFITTQECRLHMLQNYNTPRYYRRKGFEDVP